MPRSKKRLTPLCKHCLENGLKTARYRHLKFIRRDADKRGLLVYYYCTCCENYFVSEHYHEPVYTDKGDALL